MSDINEQLETISSKVGVLKNNKVVKFSYTNTAYENDVADGVGAYDYSAENNIPAISAVDTNDIVLSKGLRAQSSSISRMLFNHVFGRTSYNLNKIVDYLKVVIDSIVSLSKRSGRYQATAKYAQYDECIVYTIEQGEIKRRVFVRTSSSPEYLTGVPPCFVNQYERLEVNYLHWQKVSGDAIYVFVPNTYQGVTHEVPEYADVYVIQRNNRDDTKPTSITLLDIKHHCYKGKSIKITCVANDSKEDGTPVGIAVYSSEDARAVTRFSTAVISVDGVTVLPIIATGGEGCSALISFGREHQDTASYSAAIARNIRYNQSFMYNAPLARRTISFYMETYRGSSSFYDITGQGIIFDVRASATAGTASYEILISLQSVTTAPSGGMFIVIKDPILRYILHPRNTLSLFFVNNSGDTWYTNCVIPFTVRNSLPHDASLASPYMYKDLAFVGYPPERVTGAGLTSQNALVLVLAERELNNMTGATTAYTVRDSTYYATWHPSFLITGSSVL